MEDYENIELRSEEFREILGTPPRWIVQYGTTVAVFGFFVIGLFSYFFTYPDVVKAPIKIGTVDPPASILAQQYGYLDSLAPEYSVVEKGDVVAVLREDSGDAGDILALDQTVRDLEKLKNEFVEYEEEEGLRLGSVETAYLSFIEVHRDQNFSRVSSFQNIEINRLDHKKQDIEQEIDFLWDQIGKIDESIAYLTGPAKEQIMELIDKSNSSPESVRQQQDRIEKVRSLEREQEDFEHQVREKEREIEDINARQFSLREGTKTNKSNRISDVRFKLYELRDAINKWKKEHLIIAPITGKLYYTDLLKAGEDRGTKKDARIMAIVPLNAEKNLQGKMYVPLTESGKIKEGQPVNIRFQAYPSTQYGLLMGTVEDKGEIPNEENGKIFISIAIDNLITSTRDTLPFEHDMEGYAHIITEDRPLLYRFFDYFLAGQ